MFQWKNLQINGLYWKHGQKLDLLTMNFFTVTGNGCAEDVPVDLLKQL
jgi:hypothetical protein